MERARSKRVNESGSEETTGYGAAVSDDEMAARRAAAKLQDARGLGSGPRPRTQQPVDESKLDPLQRAILARNKKKRTGAEAAAALGNR